MARAIRWLLLACVAILLTAVLAGCYQPSRAPRCGPDLHDCFARAPRR